MVETNEPCTDTHIAARRLSVQSFALCHDAVVCWAVTFQFIRLLQLAQHLLTVFK